MADLLYRRYRRKISERLIGRILQSTGWTRTTIHYIVATSSEFLRASTGFHVNEAPLFANYVT
jgi:hypothetical protein